MAAINQNNCNVSNIKPLEVQCVVTNTTSPDSQDGSIQLQIIGGSAPYTVTWSNNGHGYSINNLGVGCYTATVTDRYQDYTVTQTCCVESDSIYLDEYTKCAEGFNPNIYVFYDGTSLNADDAQEASESIRNWYQEKYNNGFGGNLYEGVIGNGGGNGENWVWWSTYPYLGSLTGGTLSDGTIVKSFGSSTGDTITNSEYDSRWCSLNVSGMCVPNIASFNFGEDVPGNQTSDIYKRINNGFTLTGTYGTNDSRSKGVPFTVTSDMDGNSDTVYGDFIGGDKEYICIIVADEADGTVGLYHGQVNITTDGPVKSDLFNKPFEQIGQGWDVNTLRGPSNRFTYDYESFLKVWEDIKDNNGSFDGYIYPVVNSTFNTNGNRAKIPFIQHSVATIEGTTISENDFENKYDTPIYEVGPLDLNLSALTRDNVYTGMTATTTYQGLNPNYQNGPGLKNFDWKVDPTVTSFENDVIGNNLNEFFSSVEFSSEKIYTEIIDNPTLIENNIYSFVETSGCYSYDDRVLSSGQTYSALTVSQVYLSGQCSNCQPAQDRPNFQPTMCLSNGEVQYEFTPSGTSNNYFVWNNSENTLTLSYNSNLNRWEVTPWTNVGLGSMVRQVNETIPTGNFINLGNTSPDTWTMSEGKCSGIPVTVSSQVSNETCRGNGNGSVILIGSGGHEPYSFRLQNVSPYPSYSITGIFNNLTPGNYLGEIQDASGNTSSTIFTIQQGEVVVNYTVSLTSNITNNGTGTRTWNYGVQVNPSLPSGVSLTFDIVLTHIQQYRDQGIATFSYDHEITKNGSINIPYTTSPETTVTTPTTCQTKPTNDITDTFTDTAYNVTYGSTDTSLNGTVTQTVTIDGQGLSCLPDCRMVGTYNTSLQVSNLSISGTECGTVTNAFTPVSENITIYDCDQSQP